MWLVFMQAGDDTTDSRSGYVGLRKVRRYPSTVVYVYDDTSFSVLVALLEASCGFTRFGIQAIGFTIERWAPRVANPISEIQRTNSTRMGERLVIALRPNFLAPQTTIFFPFPFFSESLWLTNSTSVANGPPSFWESPYPSTCVLKCLPIASIRARSLSSSDVLLPTGAARVQIERR